MEYTYDGDGNLVAEGGKIGTNKVEKDYLYTVENWLKAVFDGDDLLVAMAYDGDGNYYGWESGSGDGSQNQSGILFQEEGEVSELEEELIGLIQTKGHQKNYELIEYVNRENG